MVNIEFNENSRQLQNNEIKMRRKIMTTSEKFYHAKKNNYSTFLKDIYMKLEN